MLLGAHVPTADPIGEAARRDAEVAQIFLSAPRAWRPPLPRDDAEVLRASALPIYVHAPYLVNVVAGDERVRTTSRQSLAQTLAAAAAIGAAGVVVHGGHQPEDADPAAGVARWRTVLEELEPPVPVLIENTSGGRNAVARHLDRIAALWEGLAGLDLPMGFCLDTCHLHAGTEDALVSGVERIIEVVGPIALVHANDSRDEPGSGRDRHENLGAGRIDPDALVAAIRLAGAPVVVETPGGADKQAADLRWLRTHLGAASGATVG